MKTVRVSMRRQFIAATLVVAAGMWVASNAHSQTEFESNYFVTSDGVELHYLEAGSGPTLVFVPGWTMPAEIWEHQIRHFSPEYRVVTLDPRGQGRSGKPTHGYQPSRRAQDIGELLDHVGSEPAVVVGWSIAMQEVLVLTHESGTDAIRAVVLVDHPIDWERAEGLTSRFVSLQVDRDEWTRSFVRAIYNSPQSDDYLEAMTQAALSMPTNAAAMMIANIILMGPTDLRPMLDSLDRPALFIASSLDWAVEQAEKVRTGWPEIRVEVIGETSHALFVDRPAEFNRVLEDFLSSLRE
jgi:microsomal epoxide hydrolase